VAGAGRKNSPFSWPGVVFSNEFERDERVLDRELLMDRVVLLRRDCARSIITGVRGLGIWVSQQKHLVIELGLRREKSNAGGLREGGGMGEG